MDISSKVQSPVAIIDEQQTVLDAAKLMVERHIGSVIVNDASSVKGIFTERDLMRVVAQQQDPSRLKLRDVIRPHLVRVGPNASIEKCLELMRTNQFRHLLVYDDGRLAGIISLRDLAALMLEEKESLVEELRKYISG